VASLYLYSLAEKGLKHLFVTLLPHQIYFTALAEISKHGDRLFSPTYMPCTLILSKFFSPTDAQVNCLKNSFKIYIIIDIKTAPTCFGAVTPSLGSALLVLAEVTVVKIAN